MTTAERAFTYEHLTDWAKLPDGIRLHETAGVAVNERDQVFCLTRNPENPILVFDADGNFIRTFGAGSFTPRAHALAFGPDGMLFATDDDTHTVTKWTPEGELLMTIGTPHQPSPRWSGDPFCRPTQAAISRRTGHIYISDGYANARVHKYTSDGKYVMGWGSPGIQPGQFMVPHNIAIDENDHLYVADREAHRVQVFDSEGKLLNVWQNVHRPCALSLGPDGNIYIGELNGVQLVEDCPGFGHRISIYNRDGEMLSAFGDPEEGDTAGRFIAPHGLGIDSKGNVYVGEVSYTIRGRLMDPPRELRSLTKLRRTG
jgi:hypothetical protein